MVACVIGMVNYEVLIGRGVRAEENRARRVHTMAGTTKAKFGFLRGGGEHEPSPTAAYVQIYVKSSSLSRGPDLAISVHLMSEAEIDEFMDDALAELEKIRVDAKKALTAAVSH